MSSATFTRPSRGDVLELTIDSLAHGGNGVARLEGYVVFVAGALPATGPRRRRQVQEGLRGGARDRGRQALARPRPRVRRPSGRALAGLPYERQLAVKAEQVEDALRRIGRLDGFELEPIVAADEQWRYRNKVEFSFGTGEEGELVCGFHPPGRWNDILDMTDCKLVSERSNALREQVVTFCREQGLPAWDRKAHRGFLRNLVIREGRRTGQTQVRLITSPGKLDVDALIAAVDADGLWWTQTADLGESTYGGESSLLSGAPQLTERLNDLDFLISPEAFFQTNTEMAEKLYGIAIEYAALRGDERSSTSTAASVRSRSASPRAPAR